MQCLWVNLWLRRRKDRDPIVPFTDMSVMIITWIIRMKTWLISYFLLVKSVACLNIQPQSKKEKSLGKLPLACKDQKTFHRRWRDVLKTLAPTNQVWEARREDSWKGRHKNNKDLKGYNTHQRQECMIKINLWRNQDKLSILTEKMTILERELRLKYWVNK